MTEQTKAQRLAAALHHELPTILRIDAENAGLELRRLDAENAAQRDEIARLRAELECEERRFNQMTDDLAAARKQMDAQKNEWLSWEEKRRSLEKDARRHRHNSE